MKKTKKLLIILSILALSILSACSDKTEDNNNTNLNSESIKIEHELGVLDLTGKPKDLVVFDYGSLENLDLLDVNVVGLPKASLPENLSKYKDDKYADLGGLKEPDFEKIYELKPDLIIISGRQADLYDEFSKIAPTLYLTIDGSKYMEDLSTNLDILSKIFDDKDVLSEQLAEINSKIDQIKDRANKDKENALFVMTNDGNISAYGKGSRFGLVHNEMNIPAADENIEVSNHGQKVAYEYIKKINPDYLFVMDRAAVVGGDNKATDMLENDIIYTTDAYKNKKIVYLNSPAWYVGAGGLESTNIMIDDILNNYN